MRVHKFTFAALAVAMSLALTACDDGDVKEKASPSPASSVSAAGRRCGLGRLRAGRCEELCRKEPQRAEHDRQVGGGAPAR